MYKQTLLFEYTCDDHLIAFGNMFNLLFRIFILLCLFDVDESQEPLKKH